MSKLNAVIFKYTEFTILLAEIVAEDYTRNNLMLCI